VSLKGTANKMPIDRDASTGWVHQQRSLLHGHCKCTAVNRSY